MSSAMYAWTLFIQAMTPSNGPNGPLAFENWPSQCQLTPGMLGCPPAVTGKSRVFHGSALQKSSHDVSTGTSLPGVACSPMNTKIIDGYVPPPNVLPGSRFCEEVVVSPPEAAFVMMNGLTTLTGQLAYAESHGGAITFPTDAVEIKANWVSPAAYDPMVATFQCPDKSGNLYTEMIDGVCFALVGLHISSKVLPDWLWATFEPNSHITNPNRCDPNLYNSCFDPWGTVSRKPYAKGERVPKQSAQLKQAMAAAGLNRAFNNYYLTGVQTTFVSNGQSVPLGNSFVEFNAKVPRGQASCITCHRYAYFDGQPPKPKKAEDLFGRPPKGWAPVGYACDDGQSGNCTPVIPNSISQDFSWMLGLMPFTAPAPKTSTHTPQP